ncbi:aldo/keto reductase [Actinoalloteichus caeruleus]|uniref:Aryl-alcohol dehydrogenase (NADP+) n=1 Tax=Actinoalloteichus caeruleus DSM 43889 TaxID=1120930 RepID=A0ABT1JHQ1_ACTCY|nr:aldo/keto reductase [Actinoalloteichus caeruleus]MCP2331983.1 aryl-alcohol dehydrogenase (NADP+) [Actinoalloteichus caeruleus DSM 43889]
MRRIGDTDLVVHPLNLGGNVFGWTADERRSFEVLDAYVAAGGNFVDTADVYSAWIPGHEGGESERVLGSWMTSRGNRDDLVIATKVGMWSERPGLSAANIRAAAEDSLRRLGTDRIDLYYAHVDDQETPLEETLTAFDELVRAGKVRHIAASNHTADRLAEALRISDESGLARYVALQPHYNLVERSGFEGELEALARREGLAVFPYFSLAKGFLTGRYRSASGQEHSSPRASGALAYLDERGERVLAELDRVAADRGVPVAAVSLAWLVAQPTVTSALASARTAGQLAELLPLADVELSEDEVAALTSASS